MKVDYSSRIHRIESYFRFGDHVGGLDDFWPLKLISFRARTYLVEGPSPNEIIFKGPKSSRPPTWSQNLKYDSILKQQSSFIQTIASLFASFCDQSGPFIIFSVVSCIDLFWLGFCVFICPFVLIDLCIDVFQLIRVIFHTFILMNVLCEIYLNQESYFISQRIHKFMS